MSIVTVFIRSACCAAALAAVAVFPIEASALECAKDPVSARGLGFSPSPEQSVTAAAQEWLKKALAIYSDAKWETAKNPDIVCASQGLYSNCKVTAVPCGTTPAPPKAP
jgi:hypothetical protein